MSDAPKSRPSFSTASRWGIGLDVVLRTLLVIAVVGMANYLATQFYQRYYLSPQTQAGLSSRTLALLRSMTNHVDVTLYYDRKADIYGDVLALLDEYREADKNISVQTVDYVRDAGAAELVKGKYRQYFTSKSDKDLVIFDCGGRVKILPGSELTSYETKVTRFVLNPDNPRQPKPEIERRPISFNGERAFTSILLALANPQPLQAYFLQGQGEPSLADDGNVGYKTFAAVLGENYMNVKELDWLGNGVPMDCSLLIIAGPDRPFKEEELQAIAQYLHEGGRLFVLYNYYSQGHPTGLEAVLRTWGVGVMDDIAQDTHTVTTHDVVVEKENFGKHPIMDSLSQYQMDLYSPRPVVNLTAGNASANAPTVTDLFATSAEGTLLGNPSEPPHHYPLAVAVEEQPVAGVTKPRGTTRIVVVGDDIFLGNYYLQSGNNSDFLNAALNWLCDRPQLLAGVGPRPVTNFRILITTHQARQLSWLLLGALPGSVLLLGGFVWLVRRK